MNLQFAQPNSRKRLLDNPEPTPEKRPRYTSQLEGLGADLTRYASELEGLGADLIGLIFKHLKLRHLAQLACVSRQWQKLTAEAPIWKKIRSDAKLVSDLPSREAFLEAVQNKNSLALRFSGLLYMLSRNILRKNNLHNALAQLQASLATQPPLSLEMRHITKIDIMCLYALQVCLGYSTIYPKTWSLNCFERLSEIKGYKLDVPTAMLAYMRLKNCHPNLTDDQAFASLQKINQDYNAAPWLRAQAGIWMAKMVFQQRTDKMHADQAVDLLQEIRQNDAARPENRHQALFLLAEFKVRLRTSKLTNDEVLELLLGSQADPSINKTLRGWMAIRCFELYRSGINEDKVTSAQIYNVLLHVSQDNSLQKRLQLYAKFFMVKIHNSKPMIHLTDDQVANDLLEILKKNSETPAGYLPERIISEVLLMLGELRSQERTGAISDEQAMEFFMLGIRKSNIEMEKARALLNMAGMWLSNRMASRFVSEFSVLAEKYQAIVDPKVLLCQAILRSEYHCLLSDEVAFSYLKNYIDKLDPSDTYIPVALFYQAKMRAENRTLQIDDERAIQILFEVHPNCNLRSGADFWLAKMCFDKRTQRIPDDLAAQIFQRFFFHETNHAGMARSAKLHLAMMQAERRTARLGDAAAAAILQDSIKNPHTTTLECRQARWLLACMCLEDRSNVIPRWEAEAWLNQEAPYFSR